MGAVLNGQSSGSGPGNGGMDGKTSAIISGVIIGVCALILVGCLVLCCIRIKNSDPGEPYEPPNPAAATGNENPLTVNGAGGTENNYNSGNNIIPTSTYTPDHRLFPPSSPSGRRWQQSHMPMYNNYMNGEGAHDMPEALPGPYSLQQPIVGALTSPTLIAGGTDEETADRPPPLYGPPSTYYTNPHNSNNNTNNNDTHLSDDVIIEPLGTTTSAAAPAGLREPHGRINWAVDSDTEEGGAGARYNGRSAGESDSSEDNHTDRHLGEDADDPKQ